jgi:hypothetical protein
MDTVTARTKALNSLIFVHDAGARGAPLIDGIGACWATPDIIAVSCLPDCDGETEIRLGRLGSVLPLDVLVFDGELNTPRRHVVLSGVLKNRILEAQVASSLTQVKIWTNGRQDTDIVVVGLG